MLLAFARNGYADTALQPKEYDFEELAERLSKPRAGAKDGSYLIRGGNLREPHRNDENLLEAELLIIDGDSSFDPETGEIINGAPPMDDVCDVLDRIGLRYIAHTSHSFIPNVLWKYRILIPARMRSELELSDCVDFIMERLHSVGVPINDVKENKTWSQPWYLPRADITRIEAFRFRKNLDGQDFDVAAAVAWAKERDARLAKERAIRAEHRPTQVNSEHSETIREFNRSHGVEWIRRELEGAGYKFAYHDKRHDAFRYIRPGSQSGTAGVCVFKGKYGDWCIYSHHGYEDPLSGKVTDPFGLLATLRHGGDTKAAWKAVHKSPEVAFRNPLEGFEIVRATEPAEQGEDAPEDAPEGFTATPFVLVDGSIIPPRQWLYGKVLIRKFVSATVSPGGIGKSSLTIVEALAMASGRKLLRDHVKAPLRVWLWNGEDPMDELQRRIVAAAKHYDIEQSDIAGRLFIDSGREKELVIAKKVDGDTVVNEPLVEQLVAEITRRQIDVMIIDPFVSSHRVSENANEEIDRVAKIWNLVADKTACAIQLVHHSRKTNGQEVTVEDSRGASALLAAARSARALNSMSTAEADELGVNEDRWRYFRADDGKANLAPRSDKASWFKMVTVDLMNGTSEMPADYVGVVTAWEPPSLFDGVSVEQINAVLDVIDAGPLDEDGNPSGLKFSFSHQSDAYVCLVVEGALGVSRSQSKKMVEAWKESGLLFSGEFKDSKRKVKMGVLVDKQKRPGKVF